MDAETSQDQPASSATSSTPQVRSRITVVCAECKRLKLKCDRRNPCSSCVKRDTTARCLYSPAAAEKVDLHSLNNRLIQVESLLAQMTSGQFTSSFPASSWPPQPPPAVASSSSDHTQSPPAPLPYTSLILPLEDVAHIWLDHLNVTTHIRLQGSSSSPSAVKTEFPSFADSEPAPAPRSTKSLPSTTIYYVPSRSQNIANLPFPGHSPPAEPPQLKTTVTQALLDILPSSAGPASLPSLLNLAEQSTYHTYPSINWTQFRARAFRMMATSFRNAPFSTSSHGHDREKDKSKARSRRDTDQDPFSMPRTSASNPLPPFNPSPSLPAQDGSDPFVKVEGVPFFGAVCAALALGALEASRGVSTNNDAMIVDSYPSFGTSSRGASSGTYLDAEYWYHLSVQALAEYERGLTVKTKAKSAEEFGLDYLVACVFQVIFLVKGGLGPISLESTDTFLGNSVDGAAASRRRKDKDRHRSIDQTRSFNGVAAIVFPLVGKMVNIARKMGLEKDPQEIYLSGDASGAKKMKSKLEAGHPVEPRAVSNLYNSEMRRRVWWDVLYYDVFISDALGHEPLITDDFNTKIPVGDVDEKVFSAVSTRIPVPQDVDPASGYSRDSFQYFRVKCRLALLVRTIQRRMCASELSTSMFNYGGATSFASKNGYGYSIDQAASMEAEVTRWLEDLPSCYRLERSNTDLSDVDPILVSQRCEVAITAQRLILKVYMPFLKKHATVSETVPAPHQAICGSVNAAHLIIRACSVLNDVWKGHDREGMPARSALSSALFDLYPMTRILFDAAVVCAHAAIKQTMPMMAAAAEEALDLALDVFKGQPSWEQLGGTSGMGGAHNVSPVEAVSLLAELKEQAVNCRGSMGPHLKRKHVDEGVDDADQERDTRDDQDHEYGVEHSEDSQEQSVFTLPPPPPPPSISADSIASHSSISSFRDETPSFPRYTGSSAGKVEKSKKAKKPHPAVGIRVRAPKEGSPTTKRRLSPPSPALPVHPIEPVQDSPTPATYSTQAPPLHVQHESQSAIPSPLSSMPHLGSESYRSRSSSLSHPAESNVYARRDSADTSYTPFSSSSSPRPESHRRYTVSNYHHPVPQSTHPPIIQSQSQPMAGAYTSSITQSTVIYDRAGSYDSQRAYTTAPPGESYVPAQSPYQQSNSPYATTTTTSGPISSASSPYTTTPTYSSPETQTVPIGAGGGATDVQQQQQQQHQAYYPYESPRYQNSFGNGPVAGSYVQERPTDVKPSVGAEAERYAASAQISVYPGQSQWQSQPPQQQQPQQYWQESPAPYYPSQ